MAEHLDALGFSRCEKCGTPTEYDANAMVQYHTLTMAPRCPTAREVAEVWAAEVRASDELARRAEALEELVRLLDKTGGKCGATFHSVEKRFGAGLPPIVRDYICLHDIDGHRQHLPQRLTDHRVHPWWTDNSPGARPSPWTSDALALLAAVTSDGEVDRG